MGRRWIHRAPLDLWSHLPLDRQGRRTLQRRFVHRRSVRMSNGANRTASTRLVQSRGCPRTRSAGSRYVVSVGTRRSTAARRATHSGSTNQVGLEETPRHLSGMRSRGARAASHSLCCPLISSAFLQCVRRRRFLRLLVCLTRPSGPSLAFAAVIATARTLSDGFPRESPLVPLSVPSARTRPTARTAAAPNAASPLTRRRRRGAEPRNDPLYEAGEKNKDVEASGAASGGVTIVEKLGSGDRPRLVQRPLRRSVRMCPGDRRHGHPSDVSRFRDVVDLRLSRHH